MEMESNGSDSDCIITDVIESRGNVLKINDKEPSLERCKLEYEEGFRIKSILGDGHRIANCFATRFKEPLDRVLDCLDSKFRENIAFYKDFSKFNEDKILREVYSYITGRRYSNSTVDVSLNAFARIYNTKVVIHNSGIDVANAAIGCNFENIIHLFKNADHFDLRRYDTMASLAFMATLAQKLIYAINIDLILCLAHFLNKIVY